MTITLPLRIMSVEEKIHIMESIWDDLFGSEGSALIPDWHGNVLAGGKTAIPAGEDEIIDWEITKIKISEDLQ